MKSLRDFKNSLERRKFLEDELKLNLDNISVVNFTEEEVTGSNIENLLGSTQIPLGVIGPLPIKHHSETKNYYVPLATTEGALVASVSRGAKAISLSGGAEVFAQDEGMTRSPIFETGGIIQSKELQNWIEKNFKNLQKVTAKTSSHLQLKKIDFATTGRNLFVRFIFKTGDAMGMNMATIATEAGAGYITKSTGVRCLTVAGNFDIDKKAAWLNFINGRGKRAWAEVILKKSVLKDVLKTDAGLFHEVALNKTLIGSALSGSMGFNAQFSNIIAALFASCGQDLGQIPESSMGIVQTKVLTGGDLYISAYLPSLEVGIVGGGTKLPAQKQALNITGVKTVLEFAEVVVATVLAGEISLIASQAQGTLAKAHINLGRKGRK